MSVGPGELLGHHLFRRKSCLSELNRMPVQSRVANLSLSDRNQMPVQSRVAAAPRTAADLAGEDVVARDSRPRHARLSQRHYA